MIRINLGTVLRLESHLMGILSLYDKETDLIIEFLKKIPKKYHSYLQSKLDDTSIWELFESYNIAKLIHNSYIDKRNEEFQKTTSYERRINPRGFFGIYSPDILNFIKDNSNLDKENYLELMYSYLCCIFFNTEIEDYINLDNCTEDSDLLGYVYTMRQNSSIDYSVGVVARYLLSSYSSTERTYITCSNTLCPKQLFTFKKPNIKLKPE